MKIFPLMAGLALLSTCALATPVLAQSAADEAAANAQAQQQDYQRQQDQYQDAQDNYRNSREAYDARRNAYDARAETYDHQRDRFLHDRAEYDSHYGAGAFVRYCSGFLDARQTREVV